MTTPRAQTDVTSCAAMGYPFSQASIRPPRVLFVYPLIRSLSLCVPLSRTVVQFFDMYSPRASHSPLPTALHRHPPDTSPSCLPSPPPGRSC